MAKLILQGPYADVELTPDPEDGQTIATCVVHRVMPLEPRADCSWTERYDTLDDAAEYAADHADRG